MQRLKLIFESARGERLELPVADVEFTPYGVWTSDYDKTATIVTGTKFSGQRWELEPQVPFAKDHGADFIRVRVERLLTDLRVSEKEEV